MNHDHYDIYKVTGGKIQEAVERWRSAKKAAINKCRKFLKRFKADGLYGTEARSSGVIFKDAGKVPVGWLRYAKAKRHDVFRPDGRLAEGKVLLQELRGLGVPGHWAFQSDVIGRDDVFRFMAPDRVIRHMCFENVGKALILFVPKVAPRKGKNTRDHYSTDADPSYGPWSPPDKHCVLLKPSAYHRLVEREAAAKEPKGKKA